MITDARRPALYQEDCRRLMAAWPEAVIDTVITDPPYGLEFMGSDWDRVVPGSDVWREVLRVSKPGAHLLAFGGTRTWHYLAIEIERGGWLIRDTLLWLYGSGMVKGLDVAKAVDKAAGSDGIEVGRDPRPIGGSVYNGGRQWAGGGAITVPETEAAQDWDGWHTGLKPAWEPIIMAMKPTAGTFADNARDHGVAGLWIDGARIDTAEERRIGDPSWGGPYKRLTAAPGQEGRTVRRSPPAAGGRWPANVILDPVAAAMVDAQSGDQCGAAAPVRAGHNGKSRGTYGDFAQKGDNGRSYRGDLGGASRFFYQAKAGRAERWFWCDICADAYPLDKEAEHVHGDPVLDHLWRHPTQKPLELVAYLAGHILSRLVEGSA